MNKVNPDFRKQVLSLAESLIDLSRENELLLEFLKIEKKKIRFYML